MSNYTLEPFDDVISDELGHDIHSRIWGGVNPDKHNVNADGSPAGDCYKCRIIRDAIRDALHRFRDPSPATPEPDPTDHYEENNA